MSVILVSIFGSIDKAPYLIKFFVGGGVPLLAARSVFQHFQRKEITAKGSSTTDQQGE